MATPIPRLTIAPYLQDWNAVTGQLTLNVLLIPVGDPRQPLTMGWASPLPASGAFSGANIVLRAAWTGDGSQRPTLVDVPLQGPQIPLPKPPRQAACFDAVADMFQITLPPVARVRTAAGTLGKYLPESYRKAFSFVAPKTELAFTDDRYHCALRCRPTGAPPKKPGKDVSWGEALAYLTRQPAAMRALGLVHLIKVQVGDDFNNGGWLFFTLDATSDFSAQQAADAEFVRIFSTRMPKLRLSTPRPVFTSVLFPVGADAVAASLLGPLDEVFPEAEIYSDGFAKIVHAAQARTNDALQEGDSGRTPLRDEGITLGWDDEDVLISQNRAIGLNPDGSTPPDAPRGVAGYRVDVRLQGASKWSSLCRVKAAALELGGPNVTESVGAFDGERHVEVHPRKLNDKFFLPIHFANWRGRSLVTTTLDDRKLDGIPGPASDIYLPVGTDEVPLRYGRTYEFRVRLADTTGGGPSPLASAFNPGDARSVTWRFKRFVAPESVRVTLAPSADPSKPLSFEVARPRMHYPQACFTEVIGVREDLLAQVDANIAGTSSTTPSISDPDVAHLQIRVRVRLPEFDPMADSEGYFTLSNTYRSFPVDPDQSKTVALEWVDCTHLKAETWENPAQPALAPTGRLRVPTARDLQIEVRAVGHDDLSYFGDERARLGGWVGLSETPLRVRAGTEAPLFVDALPVQRLASVFLQPDPALDAPTAIAVAQARSSPVLAKRLATAVNLLEDEGTLIAEPGSRIIFGASRGVKHHLAPDSSAFSFSALSELPHLWISVLRLGLNRDWTWLGSGSPTFSIKRRVKLLPHGPITSTELGDVVVQHVVNRQAVRGDEIDRETSEFVFIDAMPPQLSANKAYETEVTYEVTALLADGSTQRLSVTNKLPVTTPPRQTPKVVSVGHALSKYQVAEDYSATAPRDRSLWIEFAEPVEDERDGYFMRVLASSPDPMLLPRNIPVADPPEYEKPALDPELVRVVRPGQADDLAGLYAMQQLIPASDSNRHFVIPLPPNLAEDAAEMFGFFTYEIRLGHRRGTEDEPFWSTAQGRFGNPFVLEGVQHPAPALKCQTQRFKDEVIISAPFAYAIHNGRRLLPRLPGTELWIALYTQVHRADGQGMRNLYLASRRANLPSRREITRYHTQAAVLKQRLGYSSWTEADIEEILASYGLPHDMPLSVVAIETLPEPNGVFSDPLGGDLGEVRILRTSPLTPISNDCCV